VATGVRLSVRVGLHYGSHLNLLKYIMAWYAALRSVSGL
jgi:hypothetical protein